jgi:hypothetical protein
VDEELKEQIRAWQRGHEMVNAFVREENRRKSPEERLDATLQLMAAGTRLFPGGRRDEIPQPHDGWQLLREQYFARHH